MSKIILSRTEIVPFYDSSWEIMSMRNFEISVTVSQEEWETHEQVKEILDKVFDEQRAVIEKKSPLIQQKQKQLKRFADLIRPIVSAQDYARITSDVKSII